MWLIPFVSGAFEGDSMIFILFSEGGYLPLISLISDLFILFCSVYGVEFISITFLVTTISGDLPFVVLFSGSVSPSDSNSPSLDC